MALIALNCFKVDKKSIWIITVVISYSVAYLCEKLLIYYFSFRQQKCKNTGKKGMNCIYLRKYLRAKFEGTITKLLTRVGKHVYPILVANMNILLISPTPLSKSKNLSSVPVIWYSWGNTDTSSFLWGFGKIFCSCRWRRMLRLRLLRFGRFTAVVGVKLANSVPRIYWVVSCVVDVFLLILARTVNSHLVTDRAWVCSCTRSTKSSMAFNFTFALQFLFLRLIHSHDVSSLGKYFCFAYWYSFLINFLAPLSPWFLHSTRLLEPGKD